MHEKRPSTLLVIVIDTDLGQSGASTVDRAGFQQLVADVGMGRAGIVLGLEVSRLARNSTDWHRLLKLCALTDTLILADVTFAVAEGSPGAGAPIVVFTTRPDTLYGAT